MKPLYFISVAVCIGAGSVGCVRAALRRLESSSRSPAEYPSGPPREESVAIGGVHTTVWAPSTRGAHPLILFSHGYKGSSTQSKFLTSYLADHGYLVVAPDHQDSSKVGGLAGFSMREFAHPDEWTDQTHHDRRDDLVNVLAGLKADPGWSGQIDWQNVGLMGHSLGGYTVLAAAGAWPSWKLPQVKAVVALSPFCAPFVQRDTLKDMHVPVMYQGGTRDYGITPTVIKGGAAFDKTASPAYFMELDGAGHLAWTDLDRQYQDTIDSYTAAFFDRYLKNGPEAPLKMKMDQVADLRSK